MPLLPSVISCYVIAAPLHLFMHIICIEFLNTGMFNSHSLSISFVSRKTYAVLLSWWFGKQGQKGLKVVNLKMFSNLKRLLLQIWLLKVILWFSLMIYSLFKLNYTNSVFISLKIEERERFCFSFTMPTFFP